MRLRSAIGSGAPAGSQQLLAHQRQFSAIRCRLQGQTGGPDAAIKLDGRAGAQQGDVITQLAIRLAELLVEYQRVQIVATREKGLVGAGQIVFAHHDAQQSGVVRLWTEETVCRREQVMMMN